MEEAYNEQSRAIKILTSLGAGKHKTRQITEAQQLQCEQDRDPKADSSFATVIVIHAGYSPGYPHGHERDGHEDEVGEEGAHPVGTTNNRNKLDTSNI